MGSSIKSSKYLWEVKRTNQTSNQYAYIDKYTYALDKYTIVYENDKYIYCKANGSKALMRFDVDNLDRVKNWDFQILLTKTKPVLEEIIPEYIHENKKAGIKAYQECLTEVKNKIRNLEREKDFLLRLGMTEEEIKECCGTYEVI